MRAGSSRRPLVGEERGQARPECNEHMCMPRIARVSLVLAGCALAGLVSALAPAALATGTVLLDTVEPPQLPTGKSCTIRVRGDGFLACGVAAVRLSFNSENRYDYPLVTVLSETELEAVIDSPPPPEEYQLRLLDAEGTVISNGSSKTLHVETFYRPPIIRSVTPSTVPDTGGSLSILGNRLSTLTQVVLETGADLLPLPVTAKTSTTATVTVPAGAVPGTYRVRVVTEGGTNVKAPTITVTDSLAGLPKPASMSPDTVPAGASTLVTVLGKNLETVASVRLSKPGAVATTIGAAGAQYGSFQFTVPPGLAAGIYSVQVVTTGGASYDARRLQLGAAEAGNPPGCPDVVTFDAKSFEIVAPNLKVRMLAGMVTYVRDLRAPGAMLARNPADWFPVGIKFDSTSVADAFADLSASLFATDFQGGATCRVVQRFSHAPSGASFRVITERVGDGFRVSVPFDSPAHDVYATHAGLYGIDRDAEMTLPVYNGSRVGRNAVLEAQYAFPIWEIHNRFLYTSPQGGSLAFDVTPTQGTHATIVGFGHSSSGLWTNFFTQARKSSLRNDAMLRILIEAVDPAFDLAMEPSRLAVANPAPAGAKRPYALAVLDSLELQGNGGNSALLEQEFAAFEAEEWGMTIPLEDRYAIYVGYTIHDNNTAYPDFDQPVDAALFGPPIAGTRLPFFNAYGLHPASPLAPSQMGNLLTVFDRTAGVEKPFIWDPDFNGIVDGPTDHWFASMASTEWRGIIEGQYQSLRSQIAAAVPGVDLDGIYLDAASSITQQDRNATTGVNIDGLATFIADLRAASPDPASFIVAGEAFTTPLTAAGISWQTRGMIFQNGIDFVRLPASFLGSRPHACGAYVIGSEARGFHHYAGGEVSSAPLVHYPTRFIGYLTGVTPTLLYQGNVEARSTQQSDTGRRAVRTLMEEGLYWSRHGVEPYFAPHAAWASPSTGVVLSVDGAPRAYTRDELRDKIVLDVWYHFAGTVPTPAQFTKCRNLTPANVLGILGFTSIARDSFTRNPTPAASHLTRPQAVDAIRTTLGIDYPLP